MDSIQVTILPDGSIKMETDKVSGPNHVNAESFLREVIKLAGGNAERKGKKGFVQHSHDGKRFHSH